MPSGDRPNHRSKQERGSSQQDRQKQGKLVPSRRRDTEEVDPMALWEKRRAQLVRQRKILIAMTVLCCLATAVWIAALSTDYWIVVDSVQKNATDDSETVLKSHLGVWRGCVRNRQKSDSVTLLGRLVGDGCSYHSLEEDDQELKTLPAVAGTIVDYRRTIVSLAGLSLLCHIMSDAFSIYTFRNGRYTFKRLAGCMHLITAATVFVLIEVVSNGTHYAKAHLLNYHPVGSVWYHGYSYYLAWLVVTQFGVAGLVFLILSKKKKSLNIVGEDGNYLPDDDS